MGLQLIELADQFSCYASGELEARNVYRDIFEDGCYEKPELSEAAPFIVDAGAHIGLFSLYIKQKYPSSKIAAFEPAPETFNALHRNLALHNISGVVTYPYGLGSKASTETLTYYAHSHANTTFVPEEKELVKGIVTELLGQDTADRYFRKVEIPVPVNRLSYFLSNFHAEVTKIDLLKIDVEGTELEVLRGLDDVHWTMVQNVVMEVSDAFGALSGIEQLLQSKGFAVTCVPQHGPERLKMYLVLGRREASE